MVPRRKPTPRHLLAIALFFCHVRSSWCDPFNSGASATTFTAPGLRSRSSQTAHPISNIDAHQISVFSQNTKNSERQLQENSSRALQDFPRSVGNIKVLVILLEIVPGRTVYTREEYEAFFNSDEIDEEFFPTGSVKSYFSQNSYGKLEIDAYVHDWTPAAKSEAECAGPDFQTGIWDEYVQCFRPALDDLEAKHVDPTDPFNWDDFKLNDDTIGHVIVIHNGYNAESGTVDPDGTPPEQRIESHYADYDNLWISPSSGTKLFSFITVSGYRGNRNERFMRINVVIHYMLVQFGGVQLYNIDLTTNGVGSFDIISFPVGFRNSATVPGNVGAYTKQRLGWVEPIEINAPGTFTLQPVFDTPDIYKISSGYPDGEYLLLENRQGLGYDEQMEDGGIVVWHVDETQLRNDDGRTRVTIIQADGRDDLKNMVNRGDSEDFYSGPDAELSDFTTPDLRSRQAGTAGSATGVRLFDFSPNGEFSPITLSVEVIPRQTTTTAPVEPEASSQSPSLAPSFLPSMTPSSSPSQLVDESAAPSVSPVPDVTPGECLSSTTPDNCQDLIDAVILMEEDCTCMNFCDGSFIGCCPNGRESCTQPCADDTSIVSCPFSDDSTQEAPSAAPTQEAPSAAPSQMVQETESPTMSSRDPANSIEVKDKGKRRRRIYWIIMGILLALLIISSIVWAYYSYVKFYY